MTLQEAKAKFRKLPNTVQWGLWMRMGWSPITGTNHQRMSGFFAWISENGKVNELIKLLHEYYNRPRY